MMGLTRYQRDCLLVLQELIDLTGVAPSLDEIAAEMGLSYKSQVHPHLVGLEERGFIRRIKGRKRSIDVLQRLPMPEEPEFVGFFLDPELVAKLLRDTTDTCLAVGSSSAAPGAYV